MSEKCGFPPVSFGALCALKWTAMLRVEKRESSPQPFKRHAASFNLFVHAREE